MDTVRKRLSEVLIEVFWEIPEHRDEAVDVGGFGVDHRQQAIKEELELLVIFLSDQLVEKFLEVVLHKIELTVVVKLGHFGVARYVRVLCVRVEDLLPDARLDLGDGQAREAGRPTLLRQDGNILPQDNLHQIQLFLLAKRPRFEKVLEEGIFLFGLQIVYWLATYVDFGLLDPAVGRPHVLL